MSNLLLEEDRIIAGLEQAFSVNKMVLFVGAQNPKEILTKEIIQLPWSCIVTSSRSDSFKNLFFEQQRQIREFCSISEFPGNIFERNVLPIIKLYGNDFPDSTDEEDLELIEEEREDECNKMLAALMRKLDFTMQLIVLGYHPGIDGEVKRTSLLLRLKDCGGAKVTFFGLSYNDDETTKLKTSLTKQNIDYFEETLGNMLSRQVKETNYGSTLSTQSDEVLFYKSGKPVTLKQSNALRYKEVGTLLTENLINEIRPLGRIQQSRWFLNFLTRSSVEGPQWYGYLKQSDFYLKRDFENPLFQLVNGILKGKDGITKDYSNPVVLEGDPASSKSVVLGSLAYRVFMNKEYPVLFVENNKLNTRDDIEVLDEFMQEIESVGDRDAKTLIIWDGSSYQNTDSLARNIAKQLDNRGRRFLLVCSAYRNLDFSSEKQVSKYRFYKTDGLEIVVSSKEEMEIAQNVHNGCYYVHASGDLSDKELADLKNKVKLYAPDLKDVLKAKWGTLEKEGNRRLFDYLYKLIVVLQPPLEMGLDRERKKFVQYAQKLLQEESGGLKPEVMNPMLEALLQAGLTVEEIEKIDQRENEISETDIHRMNTCIALFSRFKLDCPVRMAFYILRSAFGDKAYTDVYSSENRKLLNVITSSMPWILYKPNSDNVFCFYYRSTLEAEILLTNSNTSPENEIDMICEMLDFYAEDYKQNMSSDLTLKNSLQKLIRMIGPNSEYFALARNNNLEHEHRGLMEHLDKIIDKLHWLRTEVGIEDDDASFVNLEITFLREYYGTNWHKNEINEVKRTAQGGNDCKVWDAYPDIFTEESYCLRLQKLNTAVDLANLCLETLRSLALNGRQKQAAANTINTLVVELCQCSIRLDELHDEYMDFCKSNSIEVKPLLKSIKPMPYSLLYRMLERTIHSNPLNGYAYNSLFRLFIKEYEKSNTERRYELLSGIRSLVDDAETNDIESRGSAETDELTRYIAKIHGYSSIVKVSIRALDAKTVDSAFIRLFDDMLGRGNASVITFICQQELDEANLTHFKAYDLSTGDTIDNRLSNFQIEKCKEICDFMSREQYAACIENDPNALYLKLKVTWMAYNRYPIMDGSVECRRTFLSRNEWIEINKLCKQYDRCAGSSRRPVVVLLQALSVVQIAGDYQEANALLESLGEDVFYAVSRMRVPYLLCYEDGSPMPYSGKVIQADEQKHRGFIKVDGIPMNMGSKKGIRFFQNNLGRRSMPHLNDVLRDLEMGIGYMGFSLYTENGRNRMGGK